MHDVRGDSPEHPDELPWVEERDLGHRRHLMEVGHFSKPVGESAEARYDHDVYLKPSGG